MASATTLGLRRSAAQLHALARVERELRANDASARRKYLRDFGQAFRNYQSIIDGAELKTAIESADVLLIGDYHALPASQLFAAEVVEKRAQPGDRPVVLAVEAVFARHQHILDEWWRREIDGEDLRQRLQFDVDWNYDWQPFYDLLVTARENADAIYGLDCMPREDLRKIGTRDRHAADKIAEIRRRHPNAVIVVLFGESHLAPAHLPRVLRTVLSGDRVLTVLQNVDALYWQAAGEREERVEAVRVNDDVVCVFNSTPLEKYESYRLCLARWNCEDNQHADMTPTVYNLIYGLLQFLGINLYSPHNSTQPRLLVDLLPEVYSGYTDGRLRQLLTRAVAETDDLSISLRQIEEQGSLYLPSINAFYIGEFQMMYAAEEAARFLHQACRGLPLRRSGQIRGTTTADDLFYIRSVEHALAYFGSRVLYPARPAVGNEAFSTKICRKLLQEANRAEGAEFEKITRQFGYSLGSELYDAYLRGAISRTVLRHVFLAHVDEPGRAQQVCCEILRKSGASRKKPCGSVTLK